MVRWGRKKDEEFGDLEFEEYTPPASEYSPPSSDADAIDEAAIDEAKPVDPNPEKEAQEVINDNLELMREVVMRIREDEEFARNIYRDCPRLQELIRKHPDIRPLFEDPKFIVINFEQVFRDAGGVLPGDPPKKPTRLERIKHVIATITSHPLFRVFKILMLIKKIVFMFSPTKLFGVIQSCFCPSVEDLDVDVEGPSPEAIKAKEAINSAADRMEDPEVQQQMQAACEDPDKMEELIENNKELRELRDSNPLCAEMMNDPETFRMISDPDNLRALGDAPELIEMDFADPDWVPEDPGVDMDAPEVEGEYEAEGEYEEEEWEEEEDEYDEEEEEEDDDDDDDPSKMLDDAEFEREDGGDDDNRARGQSARGQSDRKNRDGEEEEEGQGHGRAMGFMAGFVGAGLGAMGGAIFDDMDALFGGGDDAFDMGGAEDAAEAEGGAGWGGVTGFEDFEGGEEEEEDEGNALMDQIEDAEYEEDEKRGEEDEGNALMDQIEDAEYEEDDKRGEEDEGEPNMDYSVLDAVEEVEYEGKEDDDPQNDKEKERDQASRSVASGSYADDSRSYDTDSHDSRSTEEWVQY